MSEELLANAGVAAARDLRTRVRRLGWRVLLGLWGFVALSVGSVAAILCVLGPPKPVADQVVAQAPPVVPHTAEAEARPSAPPPSPPAAEPAPRAVAEAAVTPADASLPRPGAVAPPNPALLEPSPSYPGGQLPRISATRQKPMQAFAAAYDATDHRPRVAILVAGIGMNEAESSAAIATLPAPVSLAVSPYAALSGPLLGNARDAGHELLLSLPMEPQGYPLNDPGDRALLTGASLAANALRLEWAMTRFTGYVGAVGALGDMRGERFAAAADQMAPVLTTLAERGLLYIDPRPNTLRLPQPPHPGPYRSVDLVLDQPAGAAELDQRLAQLEAIARDRGSAIGFVGRPTPVAVDRISVWAVGLDAHGVSLAPASVVVQMPQAPPSALTASAEITSAAALRTRQSP